MFDFSKNLNPDEVNETATSGGSIPPGKYTAELVNHISKDVNGVVVDELSFKITRGKFKGRKVNADLFHEGKDEEKTRKLQSQCVHFAVQLGCMQVVEKKGGKKEYKNILDGFEDAIGTEVIIAVINNPDKNTGVVYSKVGMFGIWSMTHEDAPKLLKESKISIDGDNAEEDDEPKHNI